MKRFKDIAEELKKGKDDPCWKGYVQVGTKKKNGKEVPNCVPKENTKEEKDTHKTKDGRTAKKGLWYNINQKKKRGEAPAKKGDPDYPKTLNIDELSIDTMKSYRQKAADDVAKGKKATQRAKGAEKATGKIYKKELGSLYRKESVELDEGRGEALKAFEGLVKRGGIDRATFQKAHDLYKATKFNELKKLIRDADTDVSEAIADLIQRHDTRAFYSMYPKATKSGDYLRNITKESKEIQEEPADRVMQKRKFGSDYMQKPGESGKVRNSNSSNEIQRLLLKSLQKSGKATDVQKRLQRNLSKNEENEVREAKVSVGSRVTLKPNKSVLDRSFIGKAGVVTNMLDGEAMVKFANGRTIAVSPRDLTVNEESMNFFEFREALKEAKGSNYEVYHKDFSSAVQYAKKEVEKKGYEIDDDEWFRKVASGPRKPSKGKTNSYNIELMKNGKPVKQRLQMQVYGMDSGKYELNMYIS